MIIIIYKTDINLRKQLFSMFGNTNNTIILSCLQGHMGTAWVDNLTTPTVAQVSVGIFVFYAGNPHAKATEELLLNLPKDILVIVNTNEWKNRIETFYKGSIEKFQRYAFKKNPEHLNSNHIQSFLSKLPEGYELKKIDTSLAQDPSFQSLSEDFTSQYISIDDYMNKGLGFCILHKGQVVCGASSYSVYDGGIEIEIDTHPDHRRKGLATVATSALILDCLHRGKYPSYDAANLESVALAQKLGYVLDESYDTYYIHSKEN
ncbi:GNAT family N-acetyltransferase [Clostridium sp. FP2]|uniref:GNAT family N-acetyltransferase n=1 Tax=Clostridium sp. FP2 TaxID=2724481 RepID=UPI001CC9F647|nr:GNAT family N-acetyltransferase [Clostridium sp. FP2]MBZ9622658.1 GNAT family N-acetyltransferase [Clostridium sp. FP2]